MTPASPTLPPIQARPRRRWWLRGLALVALLLIVVVGLYSYVTISSRMSLAEAEAEADRTDPDWRLDSLEAKRRVVADKDNSALHVIAVMGKGKGVSIRGVPNYERHFEKLTPTAQLNFDQERIIRGELAKIVKPIEDARLLKDMPYGRFKINYSQDFISTLLPDHQSSREIADWLLHDAFLLAQEDQPDQALESCQAIFNVGRTMGDELFLISHLIRVAIQTLGVTAVERVLAQGEARDESLEKLQALLATEMKECTWQHGIRGERAGSQLMMDGIATGKVNLRVFRGLTGMKSFGPARDWFHEHFPATFLRNYPEHLATMNQYVALSKLPLHQQRKPLEDLDEKLLTSGNIVSRMLGPSFTKIYEGDCRSQAHLRATWVALACERYRLKHERWPASLDVLVKEKLIDAIPLDPYDGQPLRYRRTKEGVVVYALGLDLVDDLGRIDRDQLLTPGFDIGIRLWDRALRRQAPLPAVIVPEEPR